MHENTKQLALSVRKLIVEMIYNAKASHIGGALSMTDILAVLYGDVLRIQPANPKDPQRDRFLLSKGHSCTGLYAVLGLKGFFPIDQLHTYSKNGSVFLSHTSHHIPGIEISAGSLGHAFAVSAGIALACKRKGSRFNTYCLISDGELDEGSNWETIMFAPQHELDNLTLIIDNNKIQSLGFVDDVIRLEPIDEKFKSFGWEVFRVDGHNHQELLNTFLQIRNNNNGKPKVVIADTIKGKGIDFMENKILWHYKSPSLNEYKEALDQLKKNENSIY
jgi:transketolase